MPISTQDLLHGVDMTGIANPSASDFNNLVDQSTPFSDGQTYLGKGLVLITKDTALSTPDVPNGTLTTKWKRYIWIRVPYITATVLQATLYTWNEDLPSDATYLKWTPITIDLSAFIAVIDTIQAQLNTTTQTANNAYNLAQSVNGLATDANANANLAVTTAGNASAAATTANATANTALGQVGTLQVGLNNALNLANAANVASSAAQTTVQNFVAVHNLAIVVESAPNGTDLGGIAAGVQQRQMNLALANQNNIISLAAGKITLVNAGTYIFDIDVPYVPDITGSNSQRVQPFLIRDADNSILIIGQSSTFEFSGVAGVDCKPTLRSRIIGTIVAVAGEVVRIDFKAESSNGKLGRAGGRGAIEYYTVCRIEQIA